MRHHFLATSRSRLCGTGSICLHTFSAVLLCLFFAELSHARGLHYGAVSDPALVACDKLEQTGKLDAARNCYRNLIGAGKLATRAEAAWALGDLKSANQWFGDAAKQSRGDAALLTRWGELYIDTHQDQQALELFKEALGADANYAFAHVGAATVLVRQFAMEANRYLSAVMESDKAPSGAKLRGLLLAARRAGK